MSDSNHNNLLTIPQAAARLNLSIAWVRRLCQAGLIQARKVGRDWVISEQALEAFAKMPRKVGRPPNTSSPNLP